MTLRLTAGTAEAVAAQHDTASSKIDGSSTGAPGALDAGLGTAYLSEIIAAVSQTAGEISALNAGIAAQVRDAADDLGETEQQVGADFARMNGHLR